MGVVDLNHHTRRPLLSSEEVQRILQELGFNPKVKGEHFRSYVSSIKRAVPETPLYEWLMENERAVVWPLLFIVAAVAALALCEASRLLPGIPDPSVVSRGALAIIALSLVWFAVLFFGLPKMREFERSNEPRHGAVWQQLPLTKWQQDRLDEVLRAIGPEAEIQVNLYHRDRRRLGWEAPLFTRGHTAYEVVLRYTNNQYALFSNYVAHT